MRKHAQFKGFKSEMDFEVFIRDRADSLEDLGAKDRMYDYFLGTVIRGFDHLLRLKEEHNQSKPKSRLFLAEADKQYIYCRAIIGGHPHLLQEWQRDRTTVAARSNLQNQSIKG